MAKDADSCGETMPRQCAARFEAGTRTMTEAAGQISRMEGKLDTLCHAVLGNGEPDTGLVVRVKRIEEVAAQALCIRRRWQNRAWQIGSSVLLLIAGAVIATVCSGCARPPGANAATITPVSTTEAPVTAEHIEKLDQKITQVQNTLTTQTTNYARDAEQAKTDRAINQARARSSDKYFGALAAILAAFAVFGWCTEKVLTGWRRDIALVAAGGAIAFAIIAVMVWPY